MSIPEPNSGCWLWLGYATSAGYGALRIGGRKVLAHRIALQSALGRQIPGNVLVCHACNNKMCVNPGHLYEGSYASNYADAVASGWKPNPSGAIASAKRRASERTRCRSGHPLSGDNMALRRNNKGYIVRVCVACSRGWSRSYRCQRRATMERRAT